MYECIQSASLGPFANQDVSRVNERHSRCFSPLAYLEEHVPQYQMTLRTPAALKRVYSEGIVG